MNDYVHSLNKVRDSATGVDGIPHSADKANPVSSAKVLESSMRDLKTEAVRLTSRSSTDNTLGSHQRRVQ